MPKWLESLMASIYTRLPPGSRPHLKKIYFWSEIRLRGLFSGRRVVKGRRVEFIGFEIAHLEDYEYLTPASTEVQVATAYSTISPGTERAVLCGLPGARRAFPYAPGYSCAGEVVRVGKHVSGYSLGDRVAGRIKHVSGESVGTDYLFRVPEGVSLEAASFIELGIITLQGIRKARILPGERVAVLGQGLIGQLANRMARAQGAASVIAVAPSRRRAAQAMAAGGATAFVEMRQPDFDPSQVNADVVIEAVGLPDAVETALRCCQVGGRVVLLGSSRGLTRDIQLGRLVQERNLTIVGAHISDLPERDSSPGRFTYREEGKLFLNLLASGRLSVAELVTWRAMPDECNAVFELLAKGGGNQVAMVFDWQAGRQAAEQ